MANNSRTSKIDRNREKVIQDRLQLLLTRMLQDEDNKYCVDCDAKGPRWASWNLGIFLCIRCAGIHRNLGVHISKVRSVNLDSWTPVQVSSMQQMGNSRGRAVYEARLPEDFRRPQSDQQMDTFIRNKYEKKKYIALEWTPTKPPDLPQGWAEIIEAEKQKKDIRSIVLPSRASNPSTESVKTTSAVKSNVPEKSKSANGNSSPITVAASKAQPAATTQSSAAFDLLGLNSGNESTIINTVSSTSLPQKLPQPSTNKSSKELTSQLDLLCIGDTTKTSNDNDFDDFVAAPTKSNGTSSNGSNNNGQFSSNDLDQLGPAFASNNSTGKKDNGGAMSKDSIMALFNTPKSGMAAPTNPLHINSNTSGQQAFTGFPTNIQSQGAQFNMNGANKFGVSQPFQNSSIPATGGINFQQQPAMLGNFGVQQQPAPMTNLNNPFLTNVSTPAVNSATSNSNQTGWGFMN